MAIDGADVIEAQLLEQCAAGPEAPRVFLRLLRLVIEEFRQALGELLGGLAQRPIGVARHEPRQIGGHGAGRGRDGHVVVVEDHDQPGVARARIVHGLIGHARRHGAVADDGDDIVAPALEVAPHRHAQPRRDGGGGMGGAKGVVVALAAPREAGEALGLAQGADALAPAREDLVGIGLMADIPDQPVARGVEDIMQRHRQLDHAKARAQMAAGDRYGVDHFRTQLVRHLFQVALGQLAKLRGRRRAVEKGRFGWGHGYSRKSRAGAKKVRRGLHPPRPCRK